MQLKHLKLVWATQKAGDKQGVNEDIALVAEIAEDTLVLAIADGAGGYFEGRDAATRQINYLRQAMQAYSCSRLPDEDKRLLRDAIINAIEDCNTSLLNDKKMSATTIAVAIVHRNTCRSIHVGDSSVLISGRLGRIKYQTVSHANVALGIEAGVLAPDEAIYHPDRHYITNFVGHQQMRIEVGAPIAISRYDTLLLCSDGVTDNIRTRTIIESIRSGVPEQCVNKLLDNCTGAMDSEHGQPDDLTLMVIRPWQQVVAQ